ncbi:MAG TPA: PAS domain-containing sensor histidine kinase [Stellaceae bacterium]|nr:PAS domain-containing sensor histidine kinase [Stellaceae bacterium]
MSVSRELVLWARRVRLSRKLALLLAIAAALSAVATFAAMRGVPPFDTRPHLDQLILLVNIVLVLPLVAIVAWRIVQVWAERRRGLAGSRLHIRLVVLFSLVAVIPTIIVAIFSYLLFSFGVQAWFSERVRTALQESLVVAEAYLHEHQQTIRADVVNMANDLNREGALLSISPDRLDQMVRAQAALRSLNEAVVFDGQGRILARTGLTFSLELQPIPQWAIQQARGGEVAILTSGNEDRVRALIRLNRFGDVFLFIGRDVDPAVLAHMAQTQSAVAQYEQLEGQRSEYQVAFTMVFFAVGILLLTGAVWVGLTFAMRLTRPISSLIIAAERVRGGDLTARVPVATGDEEFGSLFRAFNRMTHQLETQQSELVEANRQLDQRRRFTEVVLSGVSAGVIGLDQNARINLPNRSASVLLGVDLEQMIGQDLAEIAPEMAGLLDQVAERPERLAESQIQLTRDGQTALLLVRIAAERNAGEVKGYVVTFDDVTSLISAQRKAAWADVARRIAHEIKNPLTPIQLSAERLKRKYTKEIRNDPETFAICTDTIIRHVGDIGRMVDEFSSFARMPAPVLKEENLAEIVRQAAFLQRTASPDIRIELDLPPQPARVFCDSRQVSQALINILKNAAEAIAARIAAGGPGAPPGEIRVRIAEDAQRVNLAVEDNGCGLPQQERDRLTEPYVTTRASGTGLGLAIVKKIMEDHRGELALEDRGGGGARITLRFQRLEARPDAPEADSGSDADPEAGRMEATHGA